MAKENKRPHVALTSDELKVLDMAARKLHAATIAHMLAMKQQQVLHREYGLAVKEADQRYRARDEAQGHYTKLLDSIAEGRMEQFVARRKAVIKARQKKAAQQARLTSRVRAITLRH